MERQSSIENGTPYGRWGEFRRRLSLLSSRIWYRYHYVLYPHDIGERVGGAFDEFDPDGARAHSTLLVSHAAVSCAGVVSTFITMVQGHSPLMLAPILIGLNLSVQLIAGITSLMKWPPRRGGYRESRDGDIVLGLTVDRFVFEKLNHRSVFHWAPNRFAAIPERPGPDLSAVREIAGNPDRSLGYQPDASPLPVPQSRKLRRFLGKIWFRYLFHVRPKQIESWAGLGRWLGNIGKAHLAVTFSTLPIFGLFVLGPMGPSAGVLAALAVTIVLNASITLASNLQSSRVWGHGRRLRKRQEDDSAVSLSGIDENSAQSYAESNLRSVTAWTDSGPRELNVTELQKWAPLNDQFAARPPTSGLATRGGCLPLRSRRSERSTRQRRL